MNIDHRKDFRESDAGKKWHQAVSESWFHEGLKVALATFELPRADDMGQAASNWHRHLGAKWFISHLLNLTEIPKPKPIDTTQNLKHLV